MGATRPPLDLDVHQLKVMSRVKLVTFGSNQRVKPRRQFGSQQTAHRGNGQLGAMDVARTRTTSLTCGVDLKDWFTGKTGCGRMRVAPTRNRKPRIYLFAHSEVSPWCVSDRIMWRLGGAGTPRGGGMSRYVVSRIGTWGVARRPRSVTLRAAKAAGRPQRPRGGGGVALLMPQGGCLDPGRKEGKVSVPVRVLWCCSAFGLLCDHEELEYLDGKC